MKWTGTFVWLSICFKLSCSDDDNPTTAAQWSPPPPTPKHYVYAEHLMAFQLIEMTRDLIQDLQEKHDNIHRLTSRYKGTQSYELGFLSAGIQEDYKGMVEMYRNLCTLQVFKSDKHNTTRLLLSYHYMQGLYGDMRAQIFLYVTALKKFQKRKKFLDMLYIPLHYEMQISKKRLLRLNTVPDEVLEDTDNLATNLKVYGVVPSRVPTSRVDRAIRKTIEEEKLTRRFNSDEGNKEKVVDIEFEIDKVFDSIKNITRAPSSV